MNTPVLSSTFFLTMLMAVGLIFFIRASVKDRTKALTFVSDLSEETLSQQLQQYFAQRAYRTTADGAATNSISLEGIVRPSIFLALFLTLLAAIGILCLSLIFSYLFPGVGSFFYWSALLSPLAGFFYWRKSKRPETIFLQTQSAQDVSQQGKTLVTVTAHRDELEELRRNLALKVAD